MTFKAFSYWFIEMEQKQELLLIFSLDLLVIKIIGWKLKMQLKLFLDII